MPEIVQFDRFINNDMLPDDKGAEGVAAPYYKGAAGLDAPHHEGVVWKHAPNFIPLEQIQKSHLQKGASRIDAPQSFRGELLKLKCSNSTGTKDVN